MSELADSLLFDESFPWVTQRQDSMTALPDWVKVQAFS